MDSNIKAKYNLDHVYCHTNENSNYFRSNNTGTGGGGRGSQDVVSLHKENKQLKAMLLLHLELMQEQSEQIQNRDKLIVTLREEIVKLKSDQIKYTTNLPSLNNNEETKENISEASNKLIAKEIPLTNKTANDNDSKTTINSTDLQVDHTSDEQSQDTDEFVKKEKSSIIGESNGKLISKIILHRIRSPPEGEGTYDEVVESDLQTTEICVEEPEKPTKSPSPIAEKKSSGPSPDLVTSPDPDPSPGPSYVQSDCKLDQETVIKNDSEESLSSEDPDDEQSQQSTTHQSSNVKKVGYMQTKREYKIHEWDEEDFNEEFNIEDADALKADAPMLEIPKWTEKEFTGKFSVEGTEDCSDETFLKRHSKLEHDEKKRKKWDVQRIREQKTIERLKRRHCKDELQENTDNEINSFYPAPETIKFIEVTDDLPVHAFGVGIPCISSSEFSLPWSQSSQLTHSISTRHQQQQQSQSQSQSVSSSSFIFLKRRRRNGQPSKSISSAAVSSLGECSSSSGTHSKNQV